jgi:8-oxo-dGTP diphosphatase
VKQIASAGAVVLDHRGRILLIRRGTPPDMGLWSVPGGRCESGESTVDACIREAFEESGLRVAVDRLLGSAVRAGRDPGTEYLITEYLCSVVDGDLCPGDDAVDARWVDLADLSSWPLTVALLDTLIEWGVAPGPTTHSQPHR